jgi:hypothetical protein
MAGIGYCVSFSKNSSYLKFMLMPTDENLVLLVDYISVSIIASNNDYANRMGGIFVGKSLQYGSNNELVSVTLKDPALPHSPDLISAYTSQVSVQINKTIENKTVLLSGEELLWFSLRQFDDIKVFPGEPLVIIVNSPVVSIVSINVEGSA